MPFSLQKEVRMAPLTGYSLTEYLRQTSRSNTCPKCHGLGVYPVILTGGGVWTQWCEVCDGWGYLNHREWLGGELLLQNCTPYDPQGEFNQGDECAEDNPDPI